MAALTVSARPTPAQASRRRGRSGLRKAAWGALAIAGHVPLVRAGAEALYARYFNGAQGIHVRLFRGIFADFAAARAAIPAGRTESYDNAPSAYRMMDEWLSIDPSDYPVMFWLATLLPRVRTVFDWGGNVGIKYFAFKKFIAYPAELVWTVNDVPAVIALGRQVAAEQGAAQLHFTSTLDELAGTDLLVSLGALQFIDDPLAALAAVAPLPAHLIFSKLPVYERDPAVTLHNMGTALCAYRLFNRHAFIAAIEALGYALVDTWLSPNVGCEIPFYPEHSIAAYSGFYFARR